MKKRTMGPIAIILTAFATAALLTVSASETRAQETAFFNPLAGLSEYLQARCESAWADSSASQSCRFRSGNIAFDRGNWNRCVITGVECRLRNTDISGWWYLNDWSGSIEDLPRLYNCNGILTYDPC